MQHTTAARQQRRGFSLIEMLLVITCIGIMAGIGASRVDWVRYRADAVSRSLAADLAKAQRLAVSLQTDVRVTVLNAQQLRLHVDANQDGAVGSTERVQTVSLDGTFAFARGTAGNLPAPEDPTEVASLVFRRDGSASRGGTFYLSEPGDSACVHCRAVAVARGTGRVTRYRSLAGAWRGEN